MIFTKEKSFYKRLITLALPIALQNLLTFSVGIADSFMIGRLGDEAVSAAFCGGQMQTLLQMFTAGIEGTVLVLAAQYWGKGDKSSIRAITSLGIIFSLSFSLLATVVCLCAPSFIISIFAREVTVIEAGSEYLRIIAASFPLFALTQSQIAAMRSVESAKIGAVSSSISLGINVLLNYILIYGNLGAPALGVKGAAIATVIARACELTVTTVYTLAIDKKLKFRPKHLIKLNTGIVRDFIKYGTPIVLAQLVWATNTLSATAIMSRVDAVGVTAAMSIAGTMNSLAYVVMNGASGAVGIIIGKTIGSGNTEKIREYSYTTEAIFIILGLISGLSLFLFRGAYISLYNVSESAAAVAASLILVLSVTFVGTCYQSACLFGLVKSGGDVSFILKNDAFFIFLIVIPAAIIALKLAAPPWVVFLCLKSDQLLKCIPAAIKINRFKWIKPLTNE